MAAPRAAVADVLAEEHRVARADAKKISGSAGYRAEPARPDVISARSDAYLVVAASGVCAEPAT